ncbi:50S ribosomal protein L13 [candidate division WWE3 bacterium]|nr:50S ribosomal protein L13 [candidate division WWE3 bacterium]
MHKKTFAPNVNNLKVSWHKVDVRGKVLGKVAAEITTLLMGKSKATFTRGVVCGDKVVVTNASKVAVTGKKEATKTYYRHSNYPGGLRAETVSEVRAKDPRKLIQYAVKGMLPNNKTRKEFMANLYVFPGDEHPHGAQVGEK